jgi:osmotically-inducible protein OsmY
MDACSTSHDDHTLFDPFVRQLAIRALERSIACRHVEAFVRDGCVILTGRVECLLMRGDAEDVVRSVPGVREVINQIELTA